MANNMTTLEVLQGVKEYIDQQDAGIVYDISKAHASGGVLAKYSSLSAALGTNGANVPQEYRQGGMSVKFVHSDDNNYVQYLYKVTDAATVATFTNVNNWQGVDAEPTDYSQNLVKSGGVKEMLNVSNLAKHQMTAINGLGIRDWSPAVITSVTNETLFYFPVTSGQLIYVKITSSATNLRIAFSQQKPASGVNVSNYELVQYAKVASLTAPNDGYICVSSASASNAFCYNAKEDIGSDVYDIQSELNGVVYDGFVVGNVLLFDKTKVFEGDAITLETDKTYSTGKVVFYDENNTNLKELSFATGTTIEAVIPDGFDHCSTTDSPRYESLLIKDASMRKVIKENDERIEEITNDLYQYVSENLTTDSQYYISSISNAYMTTSNSKITSNQYTSNYKVSLFSLPAGKYNLKQTAIASNLALFAKISSVSDFVVGGSLSQILVVGDGTSKDNIVVFESPTLLVMLNNASSFNHYCSLYAMSKESKIEALDSRVRALENPSSYLALTIPDIVYAIVGTEMNLWNDAISLSIDKGLYSPSNYQVRWECNKGTITDRCFRYTPSSDDAGQSITCTCYLYDMQDKLITSKQFTIKVLAKNALQSAKNIVYFGDSLGAGAATALYNDFNDNEKFAGTIPIMLGTRGTTNKYEAVGGYRWANYATSGSPAYRVSVSGVASVGLGAVYSDGSHDFNVIEVNINEGNGNLLLERYYTNPGTLIIPSGTLTRISGSGDDTISYTGAFEESANPLWNDTTNQLDINQYKSMIGLQSTDKIDAVSFQFGINDAFLADNLTTLMSYIDALYHCFVDDNANCKFIIGLTTSSGNDLNGRGANNGASGDWHIYLDRVYRIRQFYLTLQNSADYPNIRIAPISLEVDRYYGYNFGIRKISQRWSGQTVSDGTHSITINEYEPYHINYVHPGGCGYGQMGDAYFASYIGFLTES